MSKITAAPESTKQKNIELFSYWIGRIILLALWISRPEDHAFAAAWLIAMMIPEPKS